MDSLTKPHWLSRSGSAREENQTITALMQSPADCIQHLHWRYDQTAVVLGRSQKITAELQNRALEYGVDICQRISGGGAVIAAPNLLSVTTLVPKQHRLASLDLVQCFNHVGECWQKALHDLGVETTLCNRVKKASAEQQWICFAGASHGELFDSQGRKLLGLAQVRKRNAIAIMMGVYVDAIDWQTLFSVHQGSFTVKDVANIDAITAHIAQHARLPVADILHRYDQHFAKWLELSDSSPAV